MPRLIFKKLCLGNPKSTTMRLLMVNHSIKKLLVILFDC